MRNNLLLIPLLLLIACKKETPVKTATIAEEPVSEDIIREAYIDSTSIGEKGKYKLELKKIMTMNSAYTDIRLFEKNDTKWMEKQHLTFDANLITDCRPIYKDFNNDGFNDFVYQSGIAARGANEIRSLFLFDPKAGKLKFIKNSPDYPNIQYNAKLNCVDAFAVYGGSTSYFLKIDSDTLRQFARVDLFDGYREIYKTDKKGKETLIKRDFFKVSYLRYKNFDPLEEYEDF